ncbi:Ig-like domain-containing protein [Enterobacter ludwigii]
MTHSNEQYYSPSPSILGSSTTSNGTELFTSKTQPRFNGSVPGEKSGIVVIWIDDVKYTAPIQPDGSYTFTPPVPLDEGLHNISIHAIKISGLIGEPALFTLHIDTTAPDAPLIEFVLDDAGSSTGARLSDEKTDDRDPVLRGNAEPGSIVKLYEGSTLLGSAQAGADGSWALEVSLSDGSHALTATATDRLGNTSAKSASFVIEIGDDSAAPEPLPGGAAQITHAVDNVGSNTGTVTSGGLTDDTTPELHGSAPAGSTVRIQYRNEAGAWTDGGNALMNGSDWSWTPPTLGTGQWEFRANAGSGWSDEFQLEIDFAPGSKTSIIHAYDDFGTDTGLLNSGTITDDRTPTLYGRGESNSVVYLHYRNTQGTWEVLDSVEVGSDGRWRYDTGSLVTGSYEFQVSQTLTRAPEGEPFALKIVAAGSYVPTIDYAWDNAGENIGKVLHNEKTDDTTPTLHGTAEANSIVNIEFWHSGEPVNTGYSVKTDSNGHWEWTTPKILTFDTWNFKVYNQAASPSAVYSLEITPVKSYFWDFNDNTLQGWHLATEYSKESGSDLVTTTNIISLGAQTILNRNYKGDVIYRDIEVKAGITYEVSFKALRYGTDGWAAKLGFSIDNKLVINHQNVTNTSQWHVFTGTYIATETKTVKIAITNNEPSYNGNDFRIDDISVNAVSSKKNNTEEVAENSHDQHGVLDISNMDESTKVKLLSQLITESRNNLFISHELNQVMIKGDRHASLSLKDIHPDGNPNTLWVQQAGFVTIAGINYHVYRNGEAELLVQEGVNVTIPETDAAPVDDGIPTSPPDIPSFGILGSAITRNGTELWTKNTQPTFNGSVPGEKSGIVVIWIDNDKYTAAIQPDGSYSFSLKQPLDEGLHNISIHAIKISGLIGEPVLFTLHIDTTAPDVPAIELAVDDAGSNTGARLYGEKTDDRRPVLRGDAEPGSIVKIYEGSTLLGSVTAAANGVWQIEVSLSEGPHTLTATATDKLGNTSKQSASFVIEIGDDAMPLPGGSAHITHAVDNVGSYTGTLTNSGLTDDATPELHGSAPAGSTVRIQYRSGTGAWTDGGNALLNGSDWSWTPPALGEGRWEFRANAGGGWSDEFLLEIDFTPGSEASITHAYDDFGALTGLLTSGAITDDRTPTLHGRGESNSVVYLHYRNVLGTWEVLDSVNVGADGRWSYDSDQLIPASYEFQASSTLTRDPSAENFALKIVAADSYVPTIDYAWDNFDGEQREVLHNGITDDITPTLHGSAEANSVVHIAFWRSGEPTNEGYSVVADNSGHWEWTPPTILPYDTWNFKAFNKASNPSVNFTIEITPPIIAKSYTWDFDDGTFQDWQASGGYKFNNNLTVRKWEYHNGTKAMGSITNNGSHDLSGEVAYNYIEVAYGKTYYISYEATRQTTNEGAGSYLGFNVDGKTIISPSQQTTTKTLYTGTYIADKSGLVKISFINASDLTSGNDFSIDNISISVVDKDQSNAIQTPESMTNHDGIIDITQTSENIKKITLDDILVQSQKNLFIANDHEQVIIIGDEASVLSWQDIISEEEIGSWAEQVGLITIAGAEYTVFVNDERNLDLLVQQDIKIEH